MKTALFQNTIAGTAHTVQIILLPNRKRYLAHCRKFTLGPERISGRATAAKMFSFSPAQVQAGSPNALLCFYTDHFDHNSIAHEVTHALLSIFRALNLSPMTTDEELFAQLHGHLTQAIIDWKADLAPCQTPDFPAQASTNDSLPLLTQLHPTGRSCLLPAPFFTINRLDLPPNAVHLTLNAIRPPINVTRKVASTPSQKPSAARD